MKQSKYIEKVTSYLHNKQNKQEIAIELQDHIDLNTQYYEDIGYDSEFAFEKAELAMGDADIVGEELHSLEHGTLVVKILLAVICILTIPFTAIVGYWFYNVDFDVSFLTFVFVAIHFLLMLFGIFLATNTKESLQI